jgi:hypothetical protein
LVPTFDGSDDFIGIGGPHEGLGVVVGFLQEAVDGGLEIDNRAEDPAFEAAFAPNALLKPVVNPLSLTTCRRGSRL